jgi:hypothetical protein
MKNCSYLLFVIIMLMAGAGVQAQITAAEGEVEYGKGTKQAAAIEIPYPPATVEQAIKDYIAQKGVKAGKSKGFLVFRGMKLKDGDPELCDLHCKVERKSRKEKNVSVVHMLVGRPGEDVTLRTAGDRHKLHDAKEFLTSMVPVVEAHNLELDIAKQQELLNKAEKKLKGLQDNQRELENKLNAIKNDQQKQMEEVTKQKTILEAMFNRRKES